MAKPRFYDLMINAVRQDTSESFEISFAIPKTLKSMFDFIPGQYLTLRSEINGEDVRRSYSICSPVGSKNLAVGIKRISGGTFSGFVSGLKCGDTLQVMSPMRKVATATSTSGRWASPYLIWVMTNSC